MPAHAYFDDEFPQKLLDCPVHEELRWPRAFVNAGEALRFDYTSRLHADDGEFVPFKHRMSTGIGVWLPADDPLAVDLADVGAVSEKVRRLNEPLDPIHMGFAQRLYFVSHEGRQVILANPGLGVDAVDAEESYRVADLPPSSFAWDFEGRRLLALSEDGDVRFVLSGGLLRLSDDAMIVG
jgi:hypothetical protein